MKIEKKRKLSLLLLFLTIEDKQMYQVHRYNGIMNRDKYYLLSKPVNYDQDNAKPGK